MSMSPETAAHGRESRKRLLKKSTSNIGLPFPNFGLTDTELPTICRCFCSFGDGNDSSSDNVMSGPSSTVTSKRFSFYVTHQVDMLTLYTNGAFGTSSTTYRGPSFMSDVPYEKQAYYRKLQARQKQHSEFPGNGNLNAMTHDNSINGSTQTGTTDEYEEEKLLLLAEEVIFLTFGVGCLSLHTTTSNSENLSFQSVWRKLVKKNPDFPFLYAVYHYFRAKNWIPKSGIQYGADYVLYQVGPAFSHSTYVVHIIGLPSRSKPSWTEIYSWQRVAVGAGKKALLCEVIPPNNFNPESTSPKCIFGIQVKEAVIERWSHSTK